MAFSVLDTDYSGTYSKYIINRATYSMDTIEKKVVNVIGNIKKMTRIKRLDYDNPFKPNEANPTTTNKSPFTLDSRLLIPKSFDIYETFNPRELEATDMAEELNEVILDRQVPDSLESNMLQLVMNRAAEKEETGMWMGSLAYAGVVADTDPRYQYQYHDGFIRKMLVDANVNKIGSPATITTSNIFTILDSMITSVTSNVKALIVDKQRFKRMKFLMSPTTENIYTSELANGTTFKGISLDSGTVPPWRNYPVVSLAGIPDNTIIFCRATDDKVSALHVGMNSMKDWQLKLMRLANNSEEFFILGKFKFDVQYSWSEEICLYTTLTTANFLP